MTVAINPKIPLSTLSVYFDGKNSKSYTEGSTISPLIGGITFVTNATLNNGYFVSNGINYIQSTTPVDLSGTSSVTVVIKAKDLANNGTLFSFYGPPKRGFPTQQQSFSLVTDDTVRNELVIDPGFESGTAPTSWILFQGTIGTTEVYSGSYSVYVASGAGGPNIITNRIACVPGEKFLLKVICKSSSSSTDASLGVRYYNSSGGTVGTRGSVATISRLVEGWQLVSGIVTAVASSANLVLDFGESTGTGGWYVDSVSVTKANSGGIYSYNTSPIFANTANQLFILVSDTGSATTPNTYNSSPLFSNTANQLFVLVSDTGSATGVVSYNTNPVFSNTLSQISTHSNASTSATDVDRHTFTTSETSFGMKLESDSVVSYMMAEANEKTISSPYNRNSVDVFTAVYKMSSEFSTENMDLYQNGNLLGSVPEITPINTQLPSSNAYVLSGENNKYLGGSVRSFQIYNRELSAEEIKQISIALGQS